MTTQASSKSPRSFFSNVSSTFTTISSSLQKQTEQGFPGTLKRLNEFSQAIQQRARELPNNLANLPGSFEAEREDFLKSKANEGGKSRDSDLVAPWEGYGAYERELKQRIMELSKDRRNFLFPPPEDTSFQFDMKAYSQSARAALQHDPELSRMRFLLVPQQVKEPTFWRNYFYRVTLVKQSVLSSTDIDPSFVMSEEKPSDNILFDFAGEEESDTEANLASSKGDDWATKDNTNKPVEPPTESVDKDEYDDDMEEWERELRRAAKEGL